MKILLDMNLSPQWVRFLEQEGFEATHWSTVGDPSDGRHDYVVGGQERIRGVLTRP
jgi:predicted nuclease of predicted toxin-antitoxin system